MSAAALALDDISPAVQRLGLRSLPSTTLKGLIGAAAIIASEMPWTEEILTVNSARDSAVNGCGERFGQLLLLNP
jgi:hypothetical protein